MMNFKCIHFDSAKDETIEWPLCVDLINYLANVSLFFY